jgi:hypothetical protein
LDETEVVPPGALLPLVDNQPASVVAMSAAISCSFLWACYIYGMSMRELFANFSWDTLMSLSPVDFVALLLLVAVVFHWVWNALIAGFFEK